ncbi:anaerobic sulfatase maturase [Vibrio maritimus]|uniref:anaerobic sulfatase maturase n=1 Tax=Vibrio maritimus TaxID=990268 RepID=UPI0040679A62
MQAPTSCHVMAKPTGSVCNIDCDYCFYLEKEKLYPDRQNKWRMSDETLEAYIRQTIEAQKNDLVQLTWQGGEPTLMGLEFFQKAVSLSAKYAGKKTVEHSFQTNGLLLNDDWCRFFKQHSFLVGLSIDGPADLNDCYRKNRAGKPTYAKALEAVELLKKHNVDFNTLTVVHRKNVSQPERVYQFLKNIGSTHIQFTPLVEREAREVKDDRLRLVLPSEALADVTEWSVPARQYGEFLNAIFDLWVRKDIGRIYVNMFDSTLSSWFGESSNICHFAPTCGHALALEANGDLYNCDHYVYPKHLLGNIHDKPIEEYNTSSQAIQFGKDKQETLNADCKRCTYKFACNGGCSKHRFAVSPSGLPNHNYFCQSYRLFFEHTATYMREMCDLLKQDRSPVELMWTLNYRELETRITKSNSVGRNSLCPCGSEKKYKRCCG